MYSRARVCENQPRLPPDKVLQHRPVLLIQDKDNPDSPVQIGSTRVHAPRRGGEGCSNVGVDRCECLNDCFVEAVAREQAADPRIALPELDCPG